MDWLGEGTLTRYGAKMTVGVHNPPRSRLASLARAPALVPLTLDSLRICLGLLTIFTVSRVHQHFSLLAKFRPALVLVVLAFGYAFLMRSALASEGLFRTWPARLMLALGVFACVSAPFGTSLGGSANYILSNYSKTLLYAFLLLVAIRGSSDLFTFVWAYVIGTGVLVWLAFFVFGLRESAQTLTARLDKLYTYDSNDIGTVLLVGLAMSLLAFQASGKHGKIAAAVVIAGIGGTIARSGSRGTFVGMLAFGVALLVMLRTVPVMKRLAFVGLTTVALAVAAPAGYWRQMATVFAPTRDYNWDSQDGRRQVALRGMGYMMSSPIFGLGINNFWRSECLLGSKARDAAPDQGVRCTSPHNSYVQAGAELGIPGLVMWVSLVWGGCFAMMRLRRRLPRSWARGTPEQRFLYLATMYVAVALVGFGITAAFVAFAWLDIVYILAAFMGGLYVSVERLLPRPVMHPGRVPAQTRGGLMPQPATAVGRRG